MSHSKRFLSAILALTSFAAFPVVAAEDGHFSLAIGTHDNLLISGGGGEPIADISGQTVGHTITVGATKLEVSFGRDANGQLSAILTSPEKDSFALHFSAGGKSIDADKAVVTLTFSPDQNGVLVDPGYVGTVEVDSHVLRARSLADDLPMPAAEASVPSDLVTPSVAATATAPVTPVANVSTEPAPAAPIQAVTPAPVTTPDNSVAETAPTAPTTVEPPLTTTAPAPTAAPELTRAPAPLASQLAPILPPTTGSSSTAPAAAPNYESVQQRVVDAMPPIAPGATAMQKLYWSEPVTAPDGSAPAVAANEIRLVEVHGTVTVVLPGGAEQIGIEGSLVPSGATVRTSANSSAALFMGGVNSARLMPNCELVVTQTLAGPMRTDVVDLKSGAVFSRIGHRDGETENYSVVTPEGVTGAGANDMLAFRGTPDDLRTKPVAKLDFDAEHLLAWNPAPTHGLISDVPGWDLGSVDTGKKDPSTYFYYCQSGGSVQSDDVRHEVLGGDNHGQDNNNNGNDGRDGNHGGNGNNNQNNGQGNNGNGHNSGGCQPQQVLQEILETLQPYNTKLKQVLTSIDNGSASQADKQFYHKLISVFFCVQDPNIVKQFEDDPKKFDKDSSCYDKTLCQDLNEFGLPSLTPH